MPEPKLFIVPKEPAQRQRVPNNLPIQPTPLIGRDREVEEVIHLLNVAKDQQPSVRLLTLTGPGGVGKTRLALQVAEETLNEFKDGVFFVELASISDPDLVIPAIASVLQLREQPGKPLVSTLIEYLQNRRLLLVLDNFEQIIPAAERVAELLAGCPNLKLMVTSRTALRLHAEREFAVSPLALPDPRQHPSVGTLAQYGAVSLFVQRASMVEFDFALTTDNAEAVVEVCRKVDGLPLAIELVAAHSKLLSPQSIVARLSNPLRLLTGGSPDATGRHHTMRAAIEWSYNLLTEEERRLFRRLSVFVGGFSLRTAEAVCNEGGETAIESDHPLAIEVLEGMEALVDKSLVRRLEQREDGDRRLEMLETVREYAWEQLVASGEAEILRRRHADYYIALAEKGNLDPATEEGLERLDQLRPELDNFRVALNWLFQAKEASAAVDALRLLQALNHFWERHTQHVEFIAWLEKALARAGSEAKPLQIWALRRGAIEAENVNDFNLAGNWLEKALQIAREMGDKWEIIECINLQSRVALGLGDYDSARSMMEEVLAASREIGNDFMVAATLINLVGVAQRQADYEHAEKLSREGLSIFTALDNKIGIMWALINLGDTLRYLGRFDEARAALLKGLVLAQEADHPLAADTLVVLGNLIMAEPNQALAKVADKLSGIRQAVRLFGLTTRLLERRGGKLETTLQTELEQNLDIARERLGAEEFNKAWEEGHSMGPDQTVELATRAYSYEAESTPKGRGRPKKRVAGGLTDREYDVAALVAQGMTNADIARQLVLSVRTVETHVANAMQKLGLHTRTELAAWAVRQGIVPDPAQN